MLVVILPVTKSANDLDKITDEVEVNESVKKTLNTSLKNDFR